MRTVIKYIAVIGNLCLFFILVGLIVVFKIDEKSIGLEIYLLLLGPCLPIICSLIIIFKWSPLTNTAPIKINVDGEILFTGRQKSYTNIKKYR